MKMKPQPIIILLILFLLCNHKALATTYVWTGANSSTWANALNWSPSTDYPGHSASTDAASITNQTNEPTLSASLANSITGLTITTGSTFVISGTTTLIVTGITVVNGELNPGSSAAVSGNTTGTIKSTTGGIIDVTGARGSSDDFKTQYTGFATYTVGAITANYAGTSAQLISVASSFKNINISNNSGVSATINVSIGGTITINFGATFTPGAANTVRGIIAGNGTLQVTRIATGIDDLTSQCTSVLKLTNLTVDYVGTATQIISTKDTFDNVTINNSSGVSLGRETLFYGKLNFISGKLSLGNDTLIINSSGSISRTGSSGYIVTNGIGVLEMTTFAGVDTFQVGSSYYNPITINDAGGGHVFDVSVSDIVTDKNNNPVTDWAVGRTWHIVSAGGATVTVTPQWNEPTDLAGADFDNTDAFVAYRDSTLTYTWTPNTGTDISAQSNPYTVTSASITFAPADVYNIGVGGGSLSPLPVSLSYFEAQYGNGKVNLSWTTASEQNNAYFDIERSPDAATWTSIGQMEGHGTSNAMNSYADVDSLAGVLPSGTIYYRLKQVDFNGVFVYSMIRSVAVSSPDITAIYPNPASNSLNVNWTDNSEENSILRLINMNGVNVYQQSVSGNGMMQKQISIIAWPSGIYYLQIINANGIILNEKVVKN